MNRSGPGDPLRGAADVHNPTPSGRREPWPEAGLTDGRCREILRRETSNSTVDERAGRFRAPGLATGPEAPEGTEVSAHAVVPFAEAPWRAVAWVVAVGLTVALPWRGRPAAIAGGIEPDFGRRMREGM